MVRRPLLLMGQGRFFIISIFILFSTLNLFTLCLRGEILVCEVWVEEETFLRILRRTFQFKKIIFEIFE